MPVQFSEIEKHNSRAKKQAIIGCYLILVSNVPLPTPGKDRVLFAIENCLLFVDAPPKEGMSHADISFQPLVQCLDVDNLIKLFTAVLLERGVLRRSNNLVCT